jgi:quinol monooxygenase YgiN
MPVTGRCHISRTPPAVRPDKGNLFYQVHQDNSDSNTLILFEGYSDDSALALHRSAGYYIQAVVEDIQTLLMDREVILTTPVKI